MTKLTTRNKLDRARELFHKLKVEKDEVPQEERPELEEELKKIDRYFKILIWIKRLKGKVEGNTTGCLPFTHYFLLYEELAIQKRVRIGNSKNLIAGLLDYNRIGFRMILRWDTSTPEGKKGFERDMSECTTYI